MSNDPIGVPRPAVDLTAARALVAGPRQKEWLDALVDPAKGFRLWEHAPRHWAVATRERMHAFVHRLRSAGYRIDLRPGPLGGDRYFLVGFDPAYGGAYRLARWAAARTWTIDAMSPLEVAARTATPADLAVELLSLLTPQQLEIANSLAAQWSEPFDNLAAAARDLDSTELLGS